MAAALAACGGSDAGGEDTPSPAPGAVYDDSRESEPAPGLYEDASARAAENLDRGLIAVQTGTGRLLSWRLLGTEYGSEIAFDVYRGERKLNDQPIADSTNFLDTTEGSGAYRVRAIVGGTRHLALSKPALLLDDGHLDIPLQTLGGGDYYVQHAWPGDLDGDGRYEFVVSRLPKGGRNASLPSYLEAYQLDGAFLWRVDMGVNAYAKAEGIAANDGPAAAISGFGDTAGYRNDDMVTVFDLDQDGRAEVLVRTATGTTFADGATIGAEGSAIDQFISVIDGLTGTEAARTAVPDDLAALGPVGGNFGVGYLDGRQPSLITRLVARGPGRNGTGFQWITVAWDYDGRQLARRWTWAVHPDPAQRQGEQRFHQIRIVDVDGDGRDEIADGNHVIDDDGSLLYVVDQAIHGDRFHIGEFDPSRPGLEGFAIQQTEVGAWTRFPWYYYDAATGTRLVTGQHPNREPDRNSADDERIWDVPRGTIADIDPRHPGYEFWAGLASPDLPAAGVWNVQGERVSRTTPSINFRIWWDGDVGAELLDGTVIDKWQPATESSERLFEPAGVAATTRAAQPFYGDVLGDWREEVLLETADNQALRLFSTPIPTQTRFYTLAHNPEYRLAFTVRGYLQSNLLDYYLGWDMPAPPPPRLHAASRR